MKVIEINGFHLSFKPQHALGNARTFMRNRDFLALRVKTDQGVCGWGEVFSSPWAAAALVRHQFARLVLGRSPEMYRSIFHDMLGTLGYDRRGPAMMAISAIDMALHDAAARAADVRVVDLLGGPLRDRVFVYASGPFMREAEEPYGHYGAEVDTYLEQGFKAVKPRAGLSPVADGEMVTKLRRQVGHDVGLMVDINQGYTSGAACTSAQAMRDANLLWIEEPVQPEDLAGYQAVARATPTPVAGGEALGSLASFREFFQAGALSMVQPDMTVCGGFSGFDRVASLADAYDLPVMPHAFSTCINFHASLQMAALLPSRRGGGPANYPFVEWDPTGNPLMELFGLRLEKDGCVALPEGPGLGIKLQPEMLNPWTVESWTVHLP
ncbi:mandelate racemase/muconate lactonizing enzyme family protein [Variovorax sp. HJSM1_2]|uniref:mandelate racemase/muconate lactonizing enzyme family protein n=1 Tax=Variovorax sp. HJSM1_2 TaxID=3366263 RepID=UPI003BDAE2E2